MRILITGLFTLVLTTTLAPTLPASANEATLCTANVPVPQPWTGWDNPKALKMVAHTRRHERYFVTPRVDAFLHVGTTYSAELVPEAQMEYLVSVRLSATGDTFGGLVNLDIPKDGVYRIGLSENVALVVTDGKSLARFNAQSDGVPCTDLHKTLDINVAAGRYIMQISGAKKSQVLIQVIPNP